MHTANRVSLLDLLTLLDANLDDDTRHRCSDGARVTGSLLSRDSLHSRVLVVDRHRTNFAVDLEPDIALSATLDNRANSHQADDEGLSRLNRNVHLLADIGAAKEVARRNDAEKGYVNGRPHLFLAILT